MIRLFVDMPLQEKALLFVGEKISHYLLHVMRCKEGDSIFCFNGTQGEWETKLHLLKKKNAQLEVIHQIRSQDNPPFCALCPAIIKKDNMDIVLQKATELGVTDIFPLLSDFCVHPHFNQDHANSIVREAAEQCERLTIPIVHTPLKIASAIKEMPSDCTCFYLSERAHDTDKLIAQGAVAFFVGPEGGWSEQEKLLFSKHSFKKIHFNVGILRAETASIAILSCWQIGRELS